MNLHWEGSFFDPQYFCGNILCVHGRQGGYGTGENQVLLNPGSR